MTYEEKVAKAKLQSARKLKIGWKCYESTGICIINDKAMAKVLTNTQGEIYEKNK